MQPHEQVYLVEEGSNPSTDFFVLPYLRDAGCPVERFNFDQLPALVGASVQVVFVRYIPSLWKEWVQQNRSVISSVVYFMDDDLLDRQVHAALPLRYRWKLWSLAQRHRQWLHKVGAQLWVSTAWLADKYREWQPSVLPPRYPHHGITSSAKTFFYHGSASHAAELEWLVPVVTGVLQEQPDLTFELIGGKTARKLFAKCHQVRVLHPMKWPAYQVLLQQPGRRVGLAPLLPGRFNAARSPTKFFDITATGAVGVYAKDPVFASLVTHEMNGLLLPMNTHEWIDAIIRLMNDDAACQRLLANARAGL
ncbi:glycosyltransferase family 1 protein [Nitrincola sp. MINF-07-Sa-05]|uniref:glycosyltransferase family 1 protein n=1 Tax=Nitrincola salilacus TaxID=3400273 RepID=UPI003917FD0E